jgi:hypothetical protein
MAVGVLEGFGEDGLRIRAASPPRPPALLRLGRIWARPQGNGWTLVDKLEPAWTG